MQLKIYVIRDKHPNDFLITGQERVIYHYIRIKTKLPIIVGAKKQADKQSY